MEEKKTLHQGILKIQTDLKLFSKKSGKNQGVKGYSGYSYFKESDLYNALKPRMKDEGISYLISLQGEATNTQLGNMWMFNSAGTLTLKCGDEREVINIHLVAINTDPAKAQGSALTYAVRYWLCKTFGIPTDELDPDTTENSNAIREAKITPKSSLNEPVKNWYQEAINKAQKSVKFKNKLTEMINKKGVKKLADIKENEIKEFIYEFDK